MQTLTLINDHTYKQPKVRKTKAREKDAPSLSPTTTATTTTERNQQQ